MATSTTRPSTDKRLRRRRRWRRALLVLVGLLVLGTVASLVFNAVTRPADRFAPLHGQDVTVDGVSVHYRVWGENGSAVVLVHGFAESADSWTPTAQALAEHHRVYAVDLAGFGYTDYTGRYALADQVALLDGFLLALHLERPTLVGHSMGAAVVGGVGLWHPSDVRGIILLDGDGLPYIGPGSGSGGQADPGKDSASRSRPWLTRGPWFTSTYRVATRWTWADTRVVRELCGTRCLAVTPQLVDEWMRPLRQGDAERAFIAQSGAGVLALTDAQERRITVPRGIIWGSEDNRNGGLRAVAEANLGHPRSITIEGAGHLSQVADPQAVSRAVDDIIAGWPAS